MTKPEQPTDMSDDAECWDSFKTWYEANWNGSPTKNSHRWVLWQEVWQLLSPPSHSGRIAGFDDWYRDFDWKSKGTSEAMQEAFLAGQKASQEALAIAINALRINADPRKGTNECIVSARDAIAQIDKLSKGIQP